MNIEILILIGEIFNLKENKLRVDIIEIISNNLIKKFSAELNRKERKVMRKVSQRIKKQILFTHKILFGIISNNISFVKNIS